MFTYLLTMVKLKANSVRQSSSNTNKIYNRPDDRNHMAKTVELEVENYSNS